MNPLVSICILTYNRESYLKELLKSIFEVDEKYFKQLEIIIIDNGSTDGTYNFLKNNPNIDKANLFRFDINKRGSAPYLELINKAKGEFLVFPGDDDVFITGAIIDLIEVCNSLTPNISLIAFGAKTIDSSGKLNSYTYTPPIMSGKSELVAKLLFDSIFWMPATCVRKSIIANKQDPLTITAFDWWIWLNAICAGDVKNVNKQLIKYRQHAGQEQKSYLKLNWEIDSLLMLGNALTDFIIPWLSNENSGDRTRFYDQISSNLRKITFDQFQIIKWTIILSTLSKFLGVNEILSQKEIATLIWKDPRFVEIWFNFEMTTEQVLDFYRANGFIVQFETDSEWSIKHERKNILYDQQTLSMYKIKKDGTVTYDINLQTNHSSDIYNDINEINLQGKLKELYANVLYKHRETETINQVSITERQMIKVFRKFKSYKIFNLFR